MIIDNNLLDEIGAEAAASARKRKNFNFHKSPNDPMQRMINVLHPNSYVQPHKHESPDKREAFILLKGRLLVILFADDGTITSRCILSRDDEVYGIEIPACTYHTIIALEQGTCVYELKDGPYAPEDDKHFAAWAPSEKEAKQAEVYLSQLMKNE